MGIAVSEPYDPELQAQNPAISGYYLGWVSCTAYGVAMGIDDFTATGRRVTGRRVRELTGDLSGGLTLPQGAAAAAKLGVRVAVRVGSNVISPKAALLLLAESDRPFGLQGNTSALIRAKGLTGQALRSTGVGVNHYVHVSRLIGVRMTSTGITADGALVFDSAADGREAGFGRAAKGPDWWPWSTVLAFAAALHPWGESDPRVLGSGKFYAGFFDGDGEPHAHLKWSAKKTSPHFPDRTRAQAPDGRFVNVYAAPDMNSRVVGTLEDGALFNAYQVTMSGADYRGSRRWYGNHAGTRWVHEYRLSHEGGTT